MTGIENNMSVIFDFSYFETGLKNWDRLGYIVVVSWKAKKSLVAYGIGETSEATSVCFLEFYGRFDIRSLATTILAPLKPY